MQGPQHPAALVYQRHQPVAAAAAAEVDPAETPRPAAAWDGAAAARRSPLVDLAARSRTCRRRPRSCCPGTRAGRRGRPARRRSGRSIGTRSSRCVVVSTRSSGTLVRRQRHAVGKVESISDDVGPTASRPPGEQSSIGTVLQQVPFPHRDGVTVGGVGEEHRPVPGDRGVVAEDKAPAAGLGREIFDPAVIGDPQQPPVCVADNEGPVPRVELDAQRAATVSASSVRPGTARRLSGIASQRQIRPSSAAGHEAAGGVDGNVLGSGPGRQPQQPHIVKSGVGGGPVTDQGRRSRRGRALGSDQSRRRGAERSKSRPSVWRCLAGRPGLVSASAMVAPPGTPALGQAADSATLIASGETGSGFAAGGYRLGAPEAGAPDAGPAKEGAARAGAAARAATSRRAPKTRPAWPSHERTSRTEPPPPAVRRPPDAACSTTPA